MLLLDKKSYDLLSYLISLEKPQTVMAISKELNQSRRKVYYHLEKINEALPESVNQIVSLPRIGILLDKDQKKACQFLLKDVTDYNYVMKSDERMILSAIFIAISTERVTIEKLMQINDVSRNTILNDLNELRESLVTFEYSIQLHSTKSRGYYFECYPLSYIQFLYKMLSDIYRGGNQTFIEFFNHKLAENLAETTYFSKDFLQFLNDYLPVSQMQLGKRINSQDSQFMIQILPFILLSYRNMPCDQQVIETLKKDFNLIWKRKEYYIAKDLADKLYRRFKLHLDEIEVGLVAMLMLSFRKDKDSHVESPDYDDMRTTLRHFITALEDRFNLEFTHKDELIKQLTQHCKALIYRKAYGISSINPLTEHIQDKYQNLYQKTQCCASILEEAWGLQLSPDDLAYLTIHLGGELRNSQVKRQETRFIIVSDDGIAIQKIVLQQCSQYLKSHQILAVFTTEQFESVKDLLDVDVIITTNQELDAVFTTITVDPILRDDHILSLIRLSKRQNVGRESYFSSQLTKCIGQYVDEERDKYNLKMEIEALLHKELLDDLKH
ncbi:ascorbate 6-phosphate lactonase [Streptococcus bovimastitidis]|uniref:Ascorbate 6-phosphate lactonase n=1 Tax=Streptococcus bovimastitidis TaxID=1856638 RepID=A0A1L8MMK3_9STRE|nr:transcription antiterminator [Streptococcus bovimastitidis]OJF71956.1 ascorbate 6-phosphate lactonase [Streptococcus bovimastitidis]